MKKKTEKMVVVIVVCEDEKFDGQTKKFGGHRSRAPIKLFIRLSVSVCLFVCVFVSLSILQICLAVLFSSL